MDIEFIEHMEHLETWGLFYKYVLPLISAWISNYIHYKVRDEITYSFVDFNGATVEVQDG